MNSFEEQQRLLRQINQTRDFLRSVPEHLAFQLAAVTAAQHAEVVRANVDRSWQDAVQQLRRAAEQRQQLLGPLAVTEDLRRGMELVRSIRTQQEVLERQLSGPAADFFRFQEELRRTMQAVDPSRLTAELGAFRSAESAMTPFAPTTAWQQVVDVVRSAQREGVGAKAAKEIASSRPNVTEADAGAMLLDTTIAYATTETGAGGVALSAEEADRVVSIGLETLSSLTPEQVGATERDDKWFMGLIRWAYDEVARRAPNLVIKPGTIELLVMIIMWQAPSFYAVYTAAQDAHEHEMQHEQVMEAIDATQTELQRGTQRLTEQMAQLVIRYQVKRPCWLREYGEKNSRRLRRVEAGLVVVQRERSGRWVHVEIQDPKAGPATGWIWDGNLQVLSIGAEPFRP